MTKKEAQQIMLLFSELIVKEQNINYYEGSSKIFDAKCELNKAIFKLNNIVKEFCPNARIYVVYFKDHEEKFTSAKEAYEYYMANKDALEVGSYDCDGNCHSISSRQN